MFVLFMIQIMKQDKSLYPPTSISNMFHMIQAGTTYSRKWCSPRTKFNILTNVGYHKVKLTIDQAILQSFKAQLKHTITKNDILTIDQEVIMLVSNHYSLKTHEGLNNKFFLLMHVFVFHSSQSKDVLGR